MDDELNREKVSAYVEELAAKYDTKGTERNFVTYDDRKIKVSGGNYGWKIDQEKETDGLMNAILSGQTDVRTPVYEQEAKKGILMTSDIPISRWIRKTASLSFTLMGTLSSRQPVYPAPLRTECIPENR